MRLSREIRAVVTRTVVAKDCEIKMAQQTSSLMINKLLQVSFFAALVGSNRVILVDASGVPDLPYWQTLIAGEPVREVAVLEDALQLSILALAVPNQA